MKRVLFASAILATMFASSAFACINDDETQKSEYRSRQKYESKPYLEQENANDALRLMADYRTWGAASVLGCLVGGVRLATKTRRVES